MGDLLDRLLRRRPAVDRPRTDSGRHHTDGFLEHDELNNALIGRAGLDKFEEMYWTDADVYGAVRMWTAPVVGATWSAEPYGGEEADDEARQVADDVEWALGMGTYAQNTPNRTPWGQHLAETANMLARSGFLPCDVTWTSAKRDDGRQLLTPRKFMVLLPRTIHRWYRDTGGDLTGLQQFVTSRGAYVDLDRQDLLYYRVNAEGDNWEGRSMLRPVYKAWSLKDGTERLDALGQEREAIGLPVVYPPPGGAQDPGAMADLEGKLALLRAGELAYLIMPGPHADQAPEMGWRFEIMGLGGAGGGGKRDAWTTINGHRDAIRAAFSEDFMRLGQGSGSKGALSTAESQSDPFTAALGAFGGIYANEVGQMIVRRLVTLNYGPDVPCPALRMTLGDSDLEQLKTYVAELVGAGAIFADDPLEDHLRQVGKLPAADPKAREERKAAEEEARQAELQASAQPAAVGEDGEEVHEAVTEKRGADGSKTVKREKKKVSRKARTLAEDTTDLQITTPVLGKRCKDCGHDAEEGKACRCGGTHTLDAPQPRQPAAHDFYVDVDTIRAALDSARVRFEAAAASYVSAAASDAALSPTIVLDGPQEPPTGLTDAYTSILLDLHATGRAAVERELHGQRRRELAAIWPETVFALADDGAPDPVKKAGWLAAKAVITAVWQTVARRRLNGAPPEAARAAGEQAGTGRAKAEGTANASSALNAGRAMAAEDFADEIRGARYTSILDANRCPACAQADDNVLRQLDDPALAPVPNPFCYGWDRCRCMLFYELNDEAPANLEDQAALEAWYLDAEFEAKHPRTPAGKFAPKTPHPDTLKEVAKLGGSTGAQLRSDPAGNLYVTKKGTHVGHLLEEDATDRAYRALGVPVPDSQLHKTEHGPVKVARHVGAATPLGNLRGHEKVRAVARIGKHFVADAVLANWDVAGLTQDNILVRDDGTPVRIDNGAGLRYRAQGQPKHSLSEAPLELWSLRESAQGAPVFGHLSWPQILDQARDVLGKRNAVVGALPGQGQREVVARRLDVLQKIVELSDAGLGESEIRAIVQHTAQPVHKVTLDADGDPVALDSEDQVLALAKDWNPADHPRDPESGRFIVAIGGIPLGVVETVAGTYTGDLASPAPSRKLEKAIKYKSTTTHTMKKGGVDYQVVKHDLQADEEGLQDLEAAIQGALTEKAYKTAPNSSAAKQGLEKALAKVQLAIKAAEYHAAKGDQDTAAAIKQTAAAAKPKPADGPPLMAAPAGAKVSDYAPGALVKIAPDDGPPLEVVGVNGNGDVLLKTPSGVTVPAAPSQPVFASSVPSAPATPAPDVANAVADQIAAAAKPGKPIKGWQMNTDAVKLKDLDLQPGDKIQYKKGGWIYTVQEITPLGHVKVQASNGKTKLYGGYKAPLKVTKADGSPITAKDPATPSPGLEKPTAATIGPKLQPSQGFKFSEMPKGAAFETLDGQLAVLDPDTDAYTGYLTAWTAAGGKVEVPQGAAPGKVYVPPADERQAHVDAFKPAASAPSAAAKAPAKPKGPAMYGGNEPPAQFAGVKTDSAAGAAFQKWQADNQARLTAPERDAVSGYTNGLYSEINSQLRSTEGVGSVSIAQKAARLDAAIAKTDPIPEPVVLSRKTTLAGWQQHAHKGQVIQDNGFLSSSVNGGTWSGQVHLKILMPAGAKGLWANTTGGSSHPGENEVILPRGSQFLVLDRQETGGATVLYVEMIV
jgi:hypothetical protein